MGYPHWEGGFGDPQWQKILFLHQKFVILHYATFLPTNCLFWKYDFFEFHWTADSCTIIQKTIKNEILTSQCWYRVKWDDIYDIQLGVHKSAKINFSQYSH